MGVASERPQVFLAMQFCTTQGDSRFDGEKAAEW